MSRLILNRRRLLGLGAASGASLILSGCDQFDFLGQRNDPVRDFLERANSLTYAAQRALVGQQAMAREFSESEIRQGQRPNGSTDPRQNVELYRDLIAGNWQAYRLRITGLVETPKEYSLTELANMPSRTQITRHDCVEGWSCIAKWTGVPLSRLLDEAKVKPAAKFVVYHCYDMMGGGLSAPEPYYTSSDLIDAFHPQTIAAYGLNNTPLPVENGAPIRIRIERALGYKQPKYVHTIELTDSLTPYGLGQGGYWEDHGYDWYGGI
ncbi:molybdopterin-dependent oxidoreductase [Devosia sp. ZB163]|uniref:molybdopterin-dependent oxidoreductase n=1 Tax=Devosia sp. ZB163 TaxID=3025938 RepID=UPI00235F5AEA|nr:molybdopterin-dependent oxidoreductase [Devosia sp. ZB163]MDC9825461.1 molybdopterin-dependent oxidoreductase [Devosia sp. ZB163]